MSYCGNFPTFKTNSASVTIECPLVDTIPEGTYAMVAITEKVTDGSNTFVVNVDAMTTANKNSVAIERTEVTATVSKIEASGTGAKITFKTGAAVSGTHSPYKKRY